MLKLKHTFAYLLLGALLACAGPVLAASDPSAEQIYRAAESGQLNQAEQMIGQVLRDHPDSARAHYVAAQVYARAGDFGTARHELATAERLAPGLPFATPAAVRELQTELSGGTFHGGAVTVPRRSAFPWLGLVILGGLVALVWMIARRRSAPVGYGYPGTSGAGAPGTPGPYGAAAPPGGYPPGYGPGGGVGSGVMGGLASGLALGAGVAAGEELVRHALDRPGGTVVPSNEPVEGPQNPDMGGNDFGLNNDDSSWDDGGSFGGDGGGDGGGDWT